MARRVICQITKEEGTNETFYRGENGKYYKSKEVYDNFTKIRDSRKAVIDYISDLVGYENGMKFPTIMTRKLNEYEFYGYDIVLDTIKENADRIDWCLNNKEFSNESSKLSYIFGIISNTINDVYLKHKRQEKQLQKINSSVDKNVEVEMNLMLSQSEPQKRSKGTDISNLLEEKGWI